MGLLNFKPMKLPKVERPQYDLSDMFINSLRTDTGWSEEEARIIMGFKKRQ